MKGILLVSDNCEPCVDMKKELATLISSGEVELIEFDKEPEKVAKLMEQYGIGLPGLLIMGSNGQLVATS